MTIQLTLPPEIEQRIVNTAEAHKMQVEEYVISLLERAHPKIKPAPLADESDEDFVAALRSLSEASNPVKLPYTTWTRAEIYQDHD